MTDQAPENRSILHTWMGSSDDAYKSVLVVILAISFVLVVVMFLIQGPKGNIKIPLMLFGIPALILLVIHVRTGVALILAVSLIGTAVAREEFIIAILNRVTGQDLEKANDTYASRKEASSNIVIARANERIVQLQNDLRRLRTDLPRTVQDVIDTQLQEQIGLTPPTGAVSSTNGTDDDFGEFSEQTVSELSKGLSEKFTEAIGSQTQQAVGDIEALNEFAKLERKLGGGIYVFMDIANGRLTFDEAEESFGEISAFRRDVRGLSAERLIECKSMKDASTCAITEVGRSFYDMYKDEAL